MPLNQITKANRNSVIKGFNDFNRILLGTENGFFFIGLYCLHCDVKYEQNHRIYDSLLFVMFSRYQHICLIVAL